VEEREFQPTYQVITIMFTIYLARKIVALKK